MVQNRRLFSIKPKNVGHLLTGDTVLLLKSQHHLPLESQTFGTVLSKIQLTLQ